MQMPLLTCNVKQVAFCVGYINGTDDGNTPRLYVSFRKKENELTCLYACEGVHMTSIALLDIMRLTAAIRWWLVDLTVTL